MITRRNFVTTIVGGALGGGLLHLSASDQIFPNECAVRSVQIPGPPAWEGRTALFVSDLHFGNFFGAADAAELTVLIRHQNPDAIFLGGDLADSPDTDLTGLLANWQPGCPTIFAPGNHDIAGHTADSRVMQQIRESGIVVLFNEAEPWDGLTVVGLPSALRASQQLGLLRAIELKIVLGHEPDMWDQYRQGDLVHLAGHTHGGQIRPFGHAVCLPTLGRKYPLGCFKGDGNRSLIVSAGVGCTGPPLRINCPPEIVRLQFCHSVPSEESTTATS